VVSQACIKVVNANLRDSGDFGIRPRTHTYKQIQMEDIAQVTIALLSQQVFILQAKIHEL
jgi:hypothetical protein